MSDFDYFHLIPQHSPLNSRSECDISATFAPGFSMGTPFIASPMSSVTGDFFVNRTYCDAGVFPIAHRYASINDQCNGLSGPGPVLQIGAAFSQSDWFRIDQLIKCEPYMLMGDIAHGDSLHFFQTVKKIRDAGYTGVVCSANIVTAEAARRAIESGCNALRVGIGGGSVCRTRGVAGVGRNTLRAIREINKAFPTVPILADGGMRHSGDIVKALAAGATGVILGRIFAACVESPAPFVNGKKVYAGMASLYAEGLRERADSGTNKLSYRQTAAEGIDELIDAKGTVQETVNWLSGGVRAGMAYLGARTIKELQDFAEWERIDAGPTIC